MASSLNRNKGPQIKLISPFRIRYWRTTTATALQSYGPEVASCGSKSPAQRFTAVVVLALLRTLTAAGQATFSPASKALFPAGMVLLASLPRISLGRRDVALWR